MSQIRSCTINWVKDQVSSKGDPHEKFLVGMDMEMLMSSIARLTMAKNNKEIEQLSSFEDAIRPSGIRGNVMRWLFKEFQMGETELNGRTAQGQYPVFHKGTPDDFGGITLSTANDLMLVFSKFDDPILLKMLHRDGINVRSNGTWVFDGAYVSIESDTKKKSGTIIISNETSVCHNGLEPPTLLIKGDKRTGSLTIGPDNADKSLYDFILRCNPDQPINGDFSRTKLDKPHGRKFETPSGLKDGFICPMLDDAFFDIGDLVSECADVINREIEKGRNVYVHCHAGVSRSCAACVAYLMKYYDDTFEEAYQFMVDRRNVHLNEGFHHQLSGMRPGTKFGKKAKGNRN